MLPPCAIATVIEERGRSSETSVTLRAAAIFVSRRLCRTVAIVSRELDGMPSQIRIHLREATAARKRSEPDRDGFVYQR